MTIMILERKLENEHGTFGVIFKKESISESNRKIFYTLEPKEDLRIKTGEYSYEFLKKSHKKEHRDCYWIGKDVLDEILMHTGNFLEDTTGCILVGTKVGTKRRVAPKKFSCDNPTDLDNSKDPSCVRDSRSALDQLIGLMGKEGVLQIKESI